MAGVVRSRTAASWQRNSQKGPVPQRRLRGSPDARFGSKPLIDGWANARPAPETSKLSVRSGATWDQF